MPPKEQWAPLRVQYAGLNFGKLCFSEDATWPGSATGGDLGPNESRIIDVLNWSPLQGWIPGLGVRLCTATENSIGPGNAVLRVSLSVQKGTKLDEVSLDVFCNDGPSLFQNNIPTRNPGVPYGGSLVSVILPHGTWQPCPIGSTSTWSIYGSYSGSGHGGTWQIRATNNTTRKKTVGIGASVFSQDCTSEQFFPPEYRGLTPFIEALLLQDQGGL